MYRTYVMADDTTSALPKDIWDLLFPVLRAEHVVESSLKATPHRFKEEPHEEYMSVIDIGPILASVGQGEFWELVRRTAAKIDRYKKGAPIPVYHQVSSAVTRLSDSKRAPLTILKAHTALQVYTPNGLEGTVTSASPIPITEDFLCLRGDPERPLSAHYDTFLLEESTRSKILTKLNALVERNEASIPTDPMGYFEASRYIYHRTTQKFRTQKKLIGKLKLVQPTEGFEEAPSFRTSSFQVRKRVSRQVWEDKPNQDFLNALSMDFDFGEETGHADALILAPFDATNAEQRTYNSVMFDSVQVAKATDRRYHPVPVVIMNYKGCWDHKIGHDIGAHFHYARSGFNKDVIRRPVHDGLRQGERIVNASDIEHIPLFYGDVLSGDDLPKLIAARNDVLNFRLRDYYRIETKRHGFRSGGTPRPEELYTATVFASACSDKLVDQKNGFAVGRMLGELKMGITSGGGDQHLMVEPLLGYNETRQAGCSHSTCVSTHSIVKSETKEGRIATCDYWEMHDLMGDRLYTLLKSGHMYISIGGGNGTGMETGASILLMKHLAPKLMRDRLIVYIGEDPSMYAEISSICGEKALNALRQNSYAMSNQGIFLFPEAAKAEPLLRASRDNYYERALHRHTIHRDSSIGDLVYA